jgi:putative ABC transport system ATP-binding protein
MKLSVKKRKKEEIIKAEGLTKIYGEGKREVRALDGVNLSVGRGEFLVVMGPSGSGKTTLLNMLGVLDKPSWGEVVLDGVRVSSVPERKLFKVRREKVGFIFQSYYLVPTLTALDNVLLPTLPLGKNHFRGKAEELLRLVGLEKRVSHKPAQLSGGEQQRVAVARALILDPPLVLADEPTGNLDSKTGGEIVRLMHSLNKKKGKTFVVVTHDPALSKTADRVAKISDGKISGR